MADLEQIRVPPPYNNCLTNGDEFYDRQKPCTTCLLDEVSETCSYPEQVDVIVIEDDSRLLEATEEEDDNPLRLLRPESPSEASTEPRPAVATRESRSGVTLVDDDNSMGRETRAETPLKAPQPAVVPIGPAYTGPTTRRSSRLVVPSRVETMVFDSAKMEREVKRKMWNPFVDTFSYGFTDAINLMYDMLTNKQPKLDGLIVYNQFKQWRGIEYETIFVHCLQILYTTLGSILHYIVARNLFYIHLNEIHLDHHLIVGHIKVLEDQIRRSRSRHPGIYCTSTVDARGLSPSPNQLRAVIALLRKYVNSDFKAIVTVDLALKDTVHSEYIEEEIRENASKHQSIQILKRSLKSRIQAFKVFFHFMEKKL